MKTNIYTGEKQINWKEVIASGVKVLEQKTSVKQNYILNNPQRTMANSNQELQIKINENRRSHISKLLVLLQEDPDATEYTKNYKELEEYLYELIEKDTSVLDGLIGALEIYLQK